LPRSWGGGDYNGSAISKLKNNFMKGDHFGGETGAGTPDYNRGGHFDKIDAAKNHVKIAEGKLAQAEESGKPRSHNRERLEAELRQAKQELADLERRRVNGESVSY